MLLVRLGVLLGLALPLCAQVSPPENLPDPTGPGTPEEFPSAGVAEPGDMSLITRFSYYDHDDSGDGNPFLDEDLTVIEPIVLFDHTVTSRFGYSVMLSFDGVTSASIDRLSKFPEQSGASGDTYFGVDLGGRWTLEDDWQVGGHLGYSTEYDYESIGFGASVSRGVADNDATIGLSLNGYIDDIQVIRFDGTEESNEDRVSASATASWYQVISPTMHGDFGATLTIQSGFLETPYNAVVVEDALLPPNPNLENLARGIEITEELPTQRVRVALYGRVRKSLKEGRAVELGGRLYGDDWGITSIAIEPRWYEALIPGKLDAMIRYRFYTQTEANDYQDQFLTAEKLRTQDSDLAELDSHTLGGRLTWHLGAEDSLSVSADTVLRSDGLDQVLTSFAWEHRF